MQLARVREIRLQPRDCPQSGVFDFPVLEHVEPTQADACPFGNLGFRPIGCPQQAAGFAYEVIAHAPDSCKILQAKQATHCERLLQSFALCQKPFLRISRSSWRVMCRLWLS